MNATVPDFLVLIGAGFLGGMLNAVAGGGSFLTLPALLFLGVPPVVANATGTAALLPGYIASAWRFRRDCACPDGMNAAVLVGLTALGGCIGASLLTMTPNRLFTALIPWLIGFATAVFAAAPWLLPAAASASGRSDRSGKARASLVSAPLLVLVSLYGGYFNGGLGILLLAAFSCMGMDNLHRMNGLKNGISALLACIAVVLYTLGGVIAFDRLPLLALAALLGGYAGAALAYRIPAQILRLGIVIIGALLTIAFLPDGAGP